ncbi:hypothetical protein ACF1GY_35830 [Streptomyces sp. NPDC014684]|uniref:hypothetical protein n=1 Tax=Streptomyces sp. NPDC014684 TaxID=3364880 RepID=UPI0037035EBB
MAERQLLFRTVTTLAVRVETPARCLFGTATGATRDSATAVGGIVTAVVTARRRGA